MNPEEQRIAIAEACGWKPLGRCGHHSQRCWEVPKWPGSRITFDGLPHYTSDLNAMHAAIQSQSQAFRAEFDRLLHALAEEKHLLITELTAQDWADTFIKVYESN